MSETEFLLKREAAKREEQIKTISASLANLRGMLKEFEKTNPHSISVAKCRAAIRKGETLLRSLKR